MSYDIKKTQVLKLNDKNYSISIPTNGQFIEVESMKTRLSNGNYAIMAKNTTLNAVIAMDLIDCISWLTVCCPQLMKDLNMSPNQQSLLNISVVESKQLIDLYHEQLFPWIESWMKVFRAPQNQIDEQSQSE